MMHPFNSSGLQKGRDISSNSQSANTIVGSTVKAGFPRKRLKRSDSLASTVRVDLQESPGHINNPTFSPAQERLADIEDDFQDCVDSLKQFLKNRICQPAQTNHEETSKNISDKPIS